MNTNVKQLAGNGFACGLRWMRVAFATVCTLVVASLSALAASPVWTGDGGDGRWNNPDNWENHAVPQNGDAVTVSGANAVNGTVNNDIPNLTLASLTFAGATAFRLSGEGVSFASAGTILVDSATASVTTALPISLAAGSNTVSVGSSPLVLEGAFSGAGATLVLNSSGGSITLAAANTHDGGTVCTAKGKLILSRPDACLAGSLLEVNGDLTFSSPGDYNFDIRNTCASGNVIYTLHPSGNTPYNFNGTVSSDTVTADIRIVNGTTAACTVNFNAPVAFPRASYHSGVRNNWNVNFNAPVHFSHMYGGAWYSSANAHTWLYATNTVGTLTPGYEMLFDLMTSNAFPGAPLVRYDQYCSGTTADTTSGYMNIHGFDQIFDRIMHSGSNASGRGTIRSYDGNFTTIKGGTITLKGTDSASTCAILMDNISLVWAPVDDFTQTFVDRDHEMTGVLVVSNGTLEVGGSATFKKVGRIVVADGARFLLNTSAANALIGVTNIEVAAGGTFEVASGATPFAVGTVIMDYSTGAAFKIPAGDTYDFLGVKVDGEPLPGDTYHPGGAIPGLTGGDIIARDLPIVPTTAVWSGGASPNDSISAPGNWTGDAAPALTGGGLAATFGNGGERAEIDRNVDWSGVAFNRDFTLDGIGVLTLRTGGIAVQAGCTDTLAAPVKLRGDQTWDVGTGGRLNVDGGVSDYFGASEVHKTGAGGLYLNAPSSSMGPFTLGSKSANGGTVYVNTSTNAFGPASDHLIRINSVNGSNPAQGVARFLTSTVVERPITFDGNNAYYNFYVDAGTIRFTRKFTQVGSMRLHFNQNVHVICEGGASLGGWTCFHGHSSAKWTFRGKTPISANYFYLSSEQNVVLETPSNSVSGIDFCSASSLTATQPRALNTEAMQVLFGNSGARLIVAGDQQIGGFMKMTGGTITSTVPSTVYFSQYDWSSAANPKDKPMTNSAVRIDGAVTLYKRGTSLFVQDCAADTTGGIGVGEGTLRLTAAAKFQKASRFLVEGTARAEIEGERCLGKSVEVYYDDTAAIKLGGDQRVAALYINGVRQTSGCYGSSASGAENVVVGFEGTGRLIVGPRGFYLTFR